MDAYEATRVVFSRIQVLDPDNAAKIMGLLLIQDHGEKEMIRLAFGPETLLATVIAKARKELGLLSPTTPSFHPAHPTLSRQNSTPSSSRFGSTFPPPLSISSPSWAPPPPDDYNNNNVAELVADDVDHLSFFHQRSRSCSVADLSDAVGSGFGWKPCLYFARGYCKNGTACRFLHGLPEDASAGAAAIAKPDPVVGIDCQLEQLQLLRSKSQRLAAFPYSPTGSSMMPLSPSSSKCMSFLLHQHNDNNQRAAAAAAAAAMMLGGSGDETHKFMGRSRLDRTDFAGMVNPGSRQIYLTFPADSTFREEDVSNYFSIYGPVQDVRIPYQQKRMFGFVTFVYPETVKLILAKGNPHFVCDARVLVKPYKEKGKVPEKKQQQGERGDFSGCNTPTGLVDSRDQYDLQQLGARMLYSGSISPTHEMFMRRKLEEQQQQQAAELQQAIEMQGRRFMGLQLMDFKSRSFSSSSPHPITTNNPSSLHGEGSSPEDKSPSPASSGGEQQVNNTVNHAAAAADKEESARETIPNEDGEFQESVEHNLPDSPFASPTKASAFASGDFFAAAAGPDQGNGNLHFPPAASLDVSPSFKSCLFQMPRFSSGHGAVGL